MKPNLGVQLALNNTLLSGDLQLPDRVIGSVIFCHGSGSSRMSPRNKYVAEQLNKAGFATLLMDLLSADEERNDRLTSQHRFDVSMLSGRVVSAIDWLRQRDELRGFPIGLFGASTGSAAAIIAAAEAKPKVAAVVSRGGRPDLAAQHMSMLEAPILLIVGGNDQPTIDANRKVIDQIRAPRELKIIGGATHLFQEPGALEQVAQLACDWFVRYMSYAASSNADEQMRS